MLTGPNMKMLYVIRHAKSSWEDAELPDFDRPLNARGKRDAGRMGKRLREKDIHPNLLLSSPARRAYATAKRIAAAVDYPKETIRTDQRLYHADDDEILTVVRKIKDKYNHVLLFGHNPGLTDFVNSLMSEPQEIENIPTCAIAAFSLPQESWREIEWGTGKLLFFDYPKSRED